MIYAIMGYNQTIEKRFRKISNSPQALFVLYRIHTYTHTSTFPVCMCVTSYYTQQNKVVTHHIHTEYRISPTTGAYR